MKRLSVSPNWSAKCQTHRLTFHRHHPPPPSPKPLLDSTPHLNSSHTSLSPNTTTKTRPPWMPIAAALAIVIIAAIIWFATRSKPAPQPNPVDEMSQAKSVADRFLDERALGNYDAAWAEYTPAFRARINRTEWLSTQERINQHGRVVQQIQWLHRYRRWLFL